MTELIITTDCEPDDIMAIWHLLRNNRSTKIIFIVGEANPVIQRKYLARWLYHWYELGDIADLSKISIALGIGSHRIVNDRLTAFDNWEDYDLTRFDSELPDAIDGVTIIALKPIKDLMRIYRADDQAFINTTIYLYGSFNLNVLVRDNIASYSHIKNLLKSFHLVYLYNRHYAMPGISCGDSKNLPQYYQLVEYDERFAPLKRALTLWNNHIGQRHEHIAQMNETSPIHVVLADQCVACCFTHPEDFDLISFDPDTIDQRPIDQSVNEDNHRYYMYTNVQIAAIDRILVD